MLASLNSGNYRNALQLTAAKEKQAKAAAQIATKNLVDSKLFSPANGIIGKGYIEPGMRVIQRISVLTTVKIDKVPMGATGIRT